MNFLLHKWIKNVIQYMTKIITVQYKIKSTFIIFEMTFYSEKKEIHIIMNLSLKSIIYISFHANNRVHSNSTGGGLIDCFVLTFFNLIFNLFTWIRRPAPFLYTFDLHCLKVFALYFLSLNHFLTMENRLLFCIIIFIFIEVLKMSKWMNISW